jgi:hypothetical protein
LRLEHDVLSLALSEYAIQTVLLTLRRRRSRVLSEIDEDAGAFLKRLQFGGTIRCDQSIGWNPSRLASDLQLNRSSRSVCMMGPFIIS